MILAIDIGNTEIVIGGIDENKTYFVERISTDKNKTDLEYAFFIKTILEIHNIKEKLIRGGIISSVVPPLSNVLKTAVEKIIKPVILVGPGIKTGLNILTDNPGQLGSDLVVNAVAVIKYYSTPAIIIDMGTATTISAIDANNNYLGTVIIPGVKVALESLSMRASQLPYISLEAPKQVIGRNTIESMRSGIVFGSAATLDGMIDYLKAELNSPDAVITATGGLSQYIIPHCKHNIIYDNDLLLKGLYEIYKKNISIS
jgi:pantothenate kinase, type III